MEFNFIIKWVNSPVMSRNLSHCDCQKSPDAPQNLCKCLAGESNGTGIDMSELFFVFKLIFLSNLNDFQLNIFMNKTCM